MIGGITRGIIQVKNGTVKNSIGEKVPNWEDKHVLVGWIDLQQGDSKHTTYNAKIQESTHVFICDYEKLEEEITPENSRMIVEGSRYDVTLIDDVMNMHRQLEIYLKYTGGQ